MSRTLYRIYLYTVWLILMLFATGATAALLAVLLRATPLDSSGALSAHDLVQPVAFGIVVWIIAALVGGFHYWLIRRDIAADPGAGAGAVRAFYLNLVEAVAAIVAILTLGLTLTTLGRPYVYAATPVGIAIAAIGLFALLEAERQRTRAAPGGALTLQRLHFIGIQAIILLFILPPFWLSALGATVEQVLISAGQFPSPCAGDSAYGPSACYGTGFSSGSAPNLPGQWAAVAWVTFALLLYGMFSANDTRSLLRQSLHFLGYAYGLVYVLVGLELAAELALRPIFGVPTQVEQLVGSSDFIAPALFGLLVMVLYAMWLARDAHQGVMGALALGLSVQAITAGILAAPFWVGVALTLDNLIERLMPGGQPPSHETWVTGLALMITGVAYIPFALRLRSRTAGSTVTGPRRAFVLALLALGTLTLAAGLVTALYAVATNAFGAPLDRWQSVARSGVVMLLVGGTIAGIYLALARDEKWIAAPATPPVAPAPTAPASGASALPTVPTATATAASVESVLDDLLSGKLTRDQAATAIRALK